MNEKVRYSPDLLKNADRSVKGISSLRGFSSPSPFVFCFKNKIGVTPKEFADEFRKGRPYKEIAVLSGK